VLGSTVTIANDDMLIEDNRMLKSIQLLSHAVVDFSDRLLIDTNADLILYFHKEPIPKLEI
jgi:adenylosuccinate synthase